MLSIVFWIAFLLFFVSSILLIVVILLQESKGGGLAEAFGGMGAETFGVKTGGINRFTFGLAFVFVITAIVISKTWNA